MPIVFEHGPPVAALANLAQHAGAVEAQRKRRAELEAMNMQMLQMRKQEQQQNLNRVFDTWKTKYGAASALQRMKADYQFQDQAKQKEYQQELKVNAFAEEARGRATWQANITALAKQRQQYELANDNAAASSTRTQIAKYFDEQMQYYTPDGQAEAQKIYRKHMKRRNEGKLSGDQIHQDEMQMYQEINDLYDDPGLRSSKGKQGWSEIVVSSDGIYTENYTMPDGTTASRYAPHPQGGIHQTANDLTELHDREDRKRTWTADKDLPTEREMYNRAVVKIIPSKDGSSRIEVTYEATELPDKNKLRRKKIDSVDAAFKKESRIDEVESGRFEEEVAEDGSRVPIMEDRTIVRGVKRRRDLIAKYGPPTEERLRMLPDGTLVPFEAPVKEGSKEYEAQLVEHLRADIKAEFGLDTIDDVDLGVEEEVPAPQPKRGVIVREEGLPQPVAPEPPAPGPGPGMGPAPDPGVAGEENQLIKQAVEPEEQVKQNLATLEKAGWSNPSVTAIDRVRRILLESPQEFPPEKRVEIKQRLAARAQAVLWAMNAGVDPIAPINQDPAEVEQEIERLINPALPGLGGGPPGGR